MKILDTNILSKIIKEEVAIDLAGEVYTNEDLKNELEVLKPLFPNYRIKLQRVTFQELELHRNFDMARYLLNYRRLINKHSKIVSFYGLKGFGDMAILAGVSTILNPVNPTLFDHSERIEVWTHDGDLKTALTEELGERIDIIDPIPT